MAPRHRSLGPSSLRLGAVAGVLCSLLGVALGEAPDSPIFPGTSRPVPEIVRALSSGRPLSMKPIGTSSIVLKVDLEGDVDAAFRPEHRLNPRGHLAELSAFRVGQLLGLDHVAPAAPCSFALAEVERLIVESHRERWQNLRSELVVRDGETLRGACMYWINGLQELGLDTPEGVKRWAGWLAQSGALPSVETTRALAAQVSDMLVFDYLIGNFDRFSGANAQGHPAAERLYLRDHNMAFFEPLRPQHHVRVLARLKRAQRFSRRLVAALRALTPARLGFALRDEDEPARGTLLTQGQMNALLDRKRAILSYVSALIDRHGEHNVLTFE